MHDLVITLAFIGIVVAPAVFAARSDTKTPQREAAPAPSFSGTRQRRARSAR